MEKITEKYAEFFQNCLKTFPMTKINDIIYIRIALSVHYSIKF